MNNPIWSNPFRDFHLLLITSHAYGVVNINSYADSNIVSFVAWPVRQQTFFPNILDNPLYLKLRLYLFGNIIITFLLF